ncbi:tetratricopeptide repeat protein [Clostridium rectalis]|uniref:tetratricopeptide repeat protein n=1 Tax=Clostridium rectalis TaxID=2040295 RepID=UPI000F63E956|nr:DnaJ domain-containing protein [Clostridium rectalis]
MINYYEELNIEKSLKGDELRKELKILQRKWMGRTNAPDLNRRQDAERKVEMIAEAEKILLNESKRKEYDVSLSESFDDNEKNTESREYNTNCTSVQELIDTAWDLIISNKPADAIVIARKATEIEVNNSKTWITLAYAYTLWKSPTEAEDAYKRAINITPNNDTYYCEFGNFYLDYNEFDKARDCADKANVLNPNSDYNKLLLANVYANTDEYDSAISIFEELIKNNPSNEGFKKMLADCYYFKGLECCYKHSDGYYYNVSEEDTKEMISNMKKAQKYNNDSELNDKIAWGEESLKKKFDKSKISLFAVPAVMFLAANKFIFKFLAVAIIAGIAYLCMRPQWRLNRNSLFGEKTVFDYSSLIVTKSIGVIFMVIVGCWRFVIEMLAGSTRD